MAGRQNTIPIPQKTDQGIQSDLHLLHTRIGFDESTLRASHLRLSGMTNKKGFLSPFTQGLTLSQLLETLKQMKESGTTGEKFQKRLELLEQNIEGLLRRQTLIFQEKKGQRNFYDVVKDQERQILEQAFRHKSLENKLRRSDQFIRQLENQIVRLRASLRQMTGLAEQNQLYRDLFTSLKNTLNQKRSRTFDIESFINQKIKPSISQFQINLDQMINNINRDKSNKFKGLLGQYARQIQKLFNSDNLNQQKIQNTILGFYTGIQNFKSYQQIQQHRQLAINYQKLHGNFSAFASLLQSKIDKLDLKSDRLQFDLKDLKKTFNTINYQGVELFQCQGYVSAATSQARTIQVPVQDARTKHLISLIGLEIKKIMRKYPKIKQQISGGLLQFLNLDILQESIEVDSLDRLKQIIVYREGIIKVDNVYNYSSQEDKKLIFHLRVLIKSLLEELQRIRKHTGINLTLDQGILGLLGAQVIEGLDIDAIIGLYRPQPKIVEVQKIVERPVFYNGTLNSSVPINVQRILPIEKKIQVAVQVQKQVPVIVESHVDRVVETLVQVKIETEKAVQVPVIRDRIIEKTIFNQVPVEKITQKIVSMYQQVPLELTKQVHHVEVIKQPYEIEKPVQIKRTVTKEIQRYIDKPVYIREKFQKIKQVEVIVEKLVPKYEYIEVERRIPYTVPVNEIVYVSKQVPVYITNTQEIQVIVPQIVQKIVPYKVIEPKIVEVNLIQEKGIIHEVQKQVLIQMTHFVKGDVQEVIKQVEVFVDKPILHQVLVTKDTQIQRMVPLYINKFQPVYIEVQIPYIQYVPKILYEEVVKVVPVIEEIIKEIKVETPVPIIVQKQVIREEKVYIDRIIEKIVEVPRVVQVQRIVEKIVVVPRIIERIVQVPRIIQKLVPYEVPVVQIVEVIREIPVDRIVEIIRQVPIQKKTIQIITQYKTIEKERIVEHKIQVEVPVEIHVEHRIPVEVIREVPVNIQREKIVQKIVELHQVTVKDRQVPVPFIQQMPIPMNTGVPVVTESHFQSIVQVQRTVQKVVVINNTEYVPKVVEMFTDKVVEKVVTMQIPGPQTIKYLPQYKQVQLIREKVVDKVHQIPKEKEIYLFRDKIVHQSHDKLMTVSLHDMVPVPKIVEIPRPQHYIHYKQIPVQVSVNTKHPIRTIYQSIKEVQVEREKIVQVQIVKQKIKEITKQIVKLLNKQVPKNISTQHVIKQFVNQMVEVPGKTQLIETVKTDIEMRQHQYVIQKVVEKIVMLPQIVQVVKHIHDITQRQSLGVATEISVEVHQSHYIDQAQALKAALLDLLNNFKTNVHRQPDLRGIITIIQKYLGYIDSWIRFPKIIQVPKQVQVIIQKDRPILVPAVNQDKQAALSVIIQKLLAQLKRIKKNNKIQLKLDDDIANLFFGELELQGVMLDQKIVQYMTTLRSKYQSFGQWSESHSLMLNSFLQDRFVLSEMVKDSNQIRNKLESEIIDLRKKIQQMGLYFTGIQCQRMKLQGDYAKIVKTLQESRQLTQEQTRQILRQHSQILTPDSYFSVIQSHSPQHFLRPTGTKMVESVIESSQENKMKDLQISKLISKFNIVDKERSQLQRKVFQLQRDVQLTKGDGQRRTTSFQKDMQNLKWDYQRRATNMEKQLNTLKTQNERYRRQQTQGQTSNIQLQTIKKRMTQDFDKRLKNIQQVHERQIEKLRQQLAQKSTSTPISARKQTQNLQLVKENKKLGQRIRQLQLQIRNLSQQVEVQQRQRHQRQGRQRIQKERIQRERQQTERLEREKQERQRLQRISSQTGSRRFERSTIQGQGTQFRTPMGQTQRRQRQQQQIQSTSSRQSSPIFETTYRSSMTLKAFMDYQPPKELITAVMLKVIDAMQQQNSRGIFNSYTPQNIYLKNFNVSNLEAMFVKFGAPILNKKNRRDGCYLAPQIHQGQAPNQKSIVFTLGVIWDELFHRDLFFKTIADVENPQIQYEVRNGQLDAILKNNLIDMLEKDPARRIEMKQARKRLSLQRFISGGH